MSYQPLQPPDYQQNNILNKCKIHHWCMMAELRLQAGEALTQKAFEKLEGESADEPPLVVLEASSDSESGAPSASVARSALYCSSKLVRNWVTASFLASLPTSTESRQSARNDSNAEPIFILQDADAALVIALTQSLLVDSLELCSNLLLGDVRLSIAGL